MEVGGTTVLIQHTEAGRMQCTVRKDKFALIQLVESQVVHCRDLMLHMYAYVSDDREQSAACKDEQLSDAQ